MSEFAVIVKTKFFYDVVRENQISVSALRPRVERCIRNADRTFGKLKSSLLAKHDFLAVFKSDSPTVYVYNAARSVLDNFSFFKRRAAYAANAVTEFYRSKLLTIGKCAYTYCSHTFGQFNGRKLFATGERIIKYGNQGSTKVYAIEFNAIGE